MTDPKDQNPEAVSDELTDEALDEVSGGAVIFSAGQTFQ
jgi:hypothetical protein